jgi:hypothetical protein
MFQVVVTVLMQLFPTEKLKCNMAAMQTATPSGARSRPPCPAAAEEKTREKQEANQKQQPAEKKKRGGGEGGGAVARRPLPEQLQGGA